MLIHSMESPLQLAGDAFSGICQLIALLQGNITKVMKLLKPNTNLCGIRLIDKSIGRGISQQLPKSLSITLQIPLPISLFRTCMEGPRQMELNTWDRIVLVTTYSLISLK